jgi:hypothetical protein
MQLAADLAEQKDDTISFRDRVQGADLGQNRRDGEPDRPRYLVRRFIMAAFIQSLELFADLMDRHPWGNIQGYQYCMRRDDVAGKIQLFPKKAKIELHALASITPY